MSKMIQHMKSESSAVKGAQEVHYSNLLPCSSHTQLMKASTWQRKHLNEAVHIFHSSVWKQHHFKANSLHILTEALHTRVTSVSLVFICLNNRYLVLLDLRMCQSYFCSSHLSGITRSRCQTAYFYSNRDQTFLAFPTYETKMETILYFYHFNAKSKLFLQFFLPRVAYFCSF